MKDGLANVNLFIVVRVFIDNFKYPSNNDLIIVLKNNLFFNIVFILIITLCLTIESIKMIVIQRTSIINTIIIFPIFLINIFES